MTLKTRYIIDAPLGTFICAPTLGSDAGCNIGKARRARTMAYGTPPDAAWAAHDEEAEILRHAAQDLPSCWVSERDCHKCRFLDRPKRNPLTFGEEVFMAEAMGKAGRAGPSFARTYANRQAAAGRLVK